MKSAVVCLVVLLLAFAAGCGKESTESPAALEGTASEPVAVAASTEPGAPEPGSFAEMRHHLNANKRTALHVTEYWKEKMGTTVTWGGKVVGATAGRGSAAQVQVANSEGPTYRGYNVMLMTSDVDTASSLEIGQRIKFRGSLMKQSPSRDGSLMITLKDVEFLGPDDSPASE